jgi:hypothetical protein
MSLANYVGRNVCLGGLQNGYRKTQLSRAHNTTHNPQLTTHNSQHQDEPPPPYPPAALPTISMAIAPTAPALGSAAPYGPTQGACGWVWRCDGWMVCLFWGQNETTSKNKEEHGASALGGRHLAATHNN